jgi:hypothetical protein
MRDKPVVQAGRRARKGERRQEQERGGWNEWQHYACNAQPCCSQTAYQPEASEWHGCWLLSPAIQRPALGASMAEQMSPIALSRMDF